MPSNNHLSSDPFIKTIHDIQLPIAVAAQSIQSATGVTLQNGAQIVVLVDPSTKMSFAAASVAAGSNWDPEETPGLAHLCEHMLFLGTKRDPEEGAFDKFTSENAGSSNAWTDDGTTNFHFSCSNTAFAEALTKFAHFFVEPTMTPSGLEREVQAVHSEDEKNHIVDYWKTNEMLKANLVDPRHPYSQYGNGNAETLWDGPKSRGIDLHATLMKYYEQHYVPANMAFVVYSTLSAEEVIQQILSPVLKNAKAPDNKNVRNVQSFSHRSDCFIAKDKLGTWTNMKTHGHIQKLHIVLPFRTTKHDADNFKTWTFLSWLVGHECRGSIVDVLRKEVLANSIETDETGIDDENSQMTASISLTTKGLRCIDKVIDVVFAGIQFLKIQSRHHPEKMRKVFDEAMSCDRLTFHSQEVPGELDDHVATLAQQCITYGPERCWSANELLTEMNSDKINEAFEFVSDAKNAYFMLDLNDPDKVLRDSAYCLEHPEVLEQMLKVEAEEAEKMERHPYGKTSSKKKHGGGSDEDDDDDDEEDEHTSGDDDEECYDDDDDGDSNEEDEEWEDCEEGDEEEEEEIETSKKQQKYKCGKKILPIQALPACNQFATQTTKYHKAKHSLPTKIDSSILSYWSRQRSDEEMKQIGLKLPTENPFICSVPEENSHEQQQPVQEDVPPPTLSSETAKEDIFINPEQIYSSKWGSVLFQEYSNSSHDNNNRELMNSSSPILQRGLVMVSFDSPFVYNTPKNRFFARTLVSMMANATAELTYFAELGALHIHMDATYRGLHFSVDGPQEKLFILVRSLIREVFCTELFAICNNSQNNDGASENNNNNNNDNEKPNRVLSNPEKYRACADRLLRKVQSLDIDSPYEQGEEWLYQYRFERRYHHSLDILKELNNAVPPFEEFWNFTQNVLFGQKISYSILVVATPTPKIRDVVREFAQEFMEKEILENTVVPNNKNVIPAVPQDYEGCEQIIVTPSRSELMKFNVANPSAATTFVSNTNRGSTSPKTSSQKSKATTSTSHFKPSIANKKKLATTAKKSASNSIPATMNSLNNSNVVPFGTFISETSTTTKQDHDPNSACVVSFYFGAASPLVVAMTDVISGLIENHFYNNLRTKETLGYIVYGYTSTLEGHRFLRLVAQSAEQDAWYLFSRTFAFLHAIQDQIFLLTQQQLQQQQKQTIAANNNNNNTTSDEAAPQRRERNNDDDCENGSEATDYFTRRRKLNETIRRSAHSHAAECRDRFKNIAELGERIWTLKNHPYGFHVQFDAAKILEDENQINVDTVLNFYKKHFLDPEHTRPMVVLVHGSNDKEMEPIPVAKTKQQKSSAQNALLPFSFFDLKISKKVETNKNKDKKKTDQEEDDDDDDDIPLPHMSSRSTTIIDTGMEITLPDFADDIADDTLKNVRVMLASKDRELYKKFVYDL